MRNHPGSVNPLIKSNNLLNNALAMQEAVRRGAVEGVMRNYRGELAECTTSNLFVVKNGAALTPPLDAGLLPGITRAFLFEVGEDGRIPVREAVLRDADLLDADEVFFTSTTRGVDAHDPGRRARHWDRSPRSDHPRPRRRLSETRHRIPPVSRFLRELRVYLHKMSQSVLQRRAAGTAPHPEPWRAMTPARWQQIQELLNAALAVPADERAQFVAVACSGNPDLQHEVDSLLAQASAASDFLSTTDHADGRLHRAAASRSSAASWVRMASDRASAAAEWATCFSPKIRGCIGSSL